ncbi:MAG TPA: efflux RND transporter periplasmic adaptor subunit [Kofleriaceae bacterium]|nr:efflux RND transporter periplasmic adaptor subunit [Kofleriaceae bacterium]
MVPLVTVVVLAIVALVFRAQLVAWFSGERGGAWSGPARVTAGPLSIEARIQPDPPRQSGDRVRVEVTDAAGNAVDGAEVKVTYDMPAMGAMQEMKSTFPAKARGGGRYEAGFDLPAGGGWGLFVDVKRGAASVTARYSFTVGSSGLQVLDSEGGAAPASGPAAPELPPQTYSPEAVRAFQRAFDAYDRVRAGLADGRVEQDAARTLGAAVREAIAQLTGVPDVVVHSLHQLGGAAEQIAAARDVAAARPAFADASRLLLAVAATDPQLTTGWRVFECPMTKGFGRWLQREPAPVNPYLGKEMGACVSTVEWKTVSAAPAGGAADSVRIDPARWQAIGVTTGPVIEGPMSLDIRATGRLTYDETRLTDVTLKVGGFVTDLRVAATGQAVRKGEILFTLYSPELYAAQQEYLFALKSRAAASGPLAGGGDALVRASEKKLRLWGLSAAQLAAIAAKGEPIENVAFPSPASGYVIEKDLVEGASFEAGMRLFRIAALDTIWVEASLYEGDLGFIKPGTTAGVALGYTPGVEYDGKVTFVYPYLDPMTRTGRVRIALANRGLALKPDMYATVTFHVALGKRVQVPAAAIIYTGPRRIVFVDAGKGSLRAQEITTGAESGDTVEVLSGLSAGDVVVTSGNFLVAAESRLRSTTNLWKGDAP